MSFIKNIAIDILSNTLIDALSWIERAIAEKHEAIDIAQRNNMPEAKHRCEGFLEALICVQDVINKKLKE